MKIIWSKRAETTFENIQEYLLIHFSTKEAHQFIELVFKQIALVSKFPKAFPESDLIKGARKATIHPHCLIIYRIENSNIRLLLFWDNRMNPQKLK